MKNTRKAFNAAAWLYGSPERTQIEAAEKFGITQGAVSNEAKVHRLTIDYCKAHEAAALAVMRERDINGILDPSAIAARLRLNTVDVVRIIRGLQILAARAEYAENSPVPANMGAQQYASGYMTAREQAARLAELIGGQDGAHLATAIRAMQNNV